MHHTLTGHDLDLICDAAELDAWVGGRGEHPIEASDAPQSALEYHGRLLGTRRALAVTGASDRVLCDLLRAVDAIAPDLGRDLTNHDLLWHKPVRGVVGGVVYLLGIEVVR